MIPTQLRKAETPSDIKGEVDKIVSTFVSRDLEVFSELKKIVSRKRVSRKIKVAAFWLLGQLGSSKACLFLKSIVINKKSRLEDRRTAVWALAKISNDSLSSFLSGVFLTETDNVLIWEAAKGLSFMRKNAPYPALIKGLNDIAHPIRREAAAYALGWSGNKACGNDLLKVLMNHKELAGIRGQAAESLGILRYKKALPALVEALQDSEIEVRFWAAYALGQIGDQKSIPYLQRLARTDKRKLRGWWTVSKEAKDAIAIIMGECCPN